MSASMNCPRCGECIDYEESTQENELLTRANNAEHQNLNAWRLAEEYKRETKRTWKKIERLTAYVASRPCDDPQPLPGLTNRTRCGRCEPCLARARLEGNEG